MFERHDWNNYESAWDRIVDRVWRLVAISIVVVISSGAFIFGITGMVIALRAIVEVL